MRDYCASGLLGASNLADELGALDYHLKTAWCQLCSSARPLECKRTVSFERLLEAVAFGSRDPDVLSSVASRLARLDQQLTAPERALVQKANGCRPLAAITRGIVEALDPDAQVEAARHDAGGAEPTAGQIARAAATMMEEAPRPLAANPELRQLLAAVKKAYEQIIDTIRKDEVIDAGAHAKHGHQANKIGSVDLLLHGTRLRTAFGAMIAGCLLLSSCPQGLKPTFSAARSGAAEAAP